jgi:branched-chain amino acid transport system substrate-binding protein
MTEGIQPQQEARASAPLASASRICPYQAASTLSNCHPSLLDTCRTSPLGLRFDRRRSRVALLASATALVMLLAACSSSNKSSPATSPSSGSGTSVVAKGSTLQIGAIADETGGCLPGPTPDQGDTLTAWQNYENSHGGIAGHPVKVTVIDTQCNPATAAAAAQTLISDRVLAIIDGSGIDSSFEKAVDAAKIPVLCGIEDGNGFTCQADPNFFPSGTTVLAGIYGYMFATKHAGATSYGVIYCTELAPCKQAIPVFQGYAKQLGLNFPNPVAASETAPNYTAARVTMQQAHADAIFGAGPPSAKLADDCAQQGYHPIYAQSMGTWQTAYLKDSHLDGTTGDTSDVPWFYHGPQTAVSQQAEDHVLTATNYPYNVSATYAAALLFQTALKNAGANPTTMDIYNALYAMHGDVEGERDPPATESDIRVGGLPARDRIGRAGHRISQRQAEQPGAEPWRRRLHEQAPTNGGGRGSTNPRSGARRPLAVRDCRPRYSDFLSCEHVRLVGRAPSGAPPTCR